jgi:ATP-dependent helicase HrpB
MADPLPIYELEQALVQTLRKERRVILEAPTGSGKSTQVPQMLLRHGLLGSGQTVILQPRRLAARLLASRVARECNTDLGRTVGYQIRFESVISTETRIRYVTEGILLRQMIQDPLLPGIQVLIFDEFHERHLYGDITLARALDIQETTRPDLKIIVMSATLDAGVLEKYLHPCVRLRSEGRMFPVEIEYALYPQSRVRPEPVWHQAVGAMERWQETGGGGDVLIFMPGAYEINQTLELLRVSRAARGYTLLPLHGELPPKDQDVAVTPSQKPKVVVATNVAETSITIDGIRLVVDGGLARIPRYDPHRGINTLLVERISRASADQRAGRAGRTAPGRCIRLWTEKEHFERILQELPEVRRLDLAEVVLTLKASGVEDLRRFRWLEAPSEHGLTDAESLLTDLGALDHQGAITPLGRSMLAFPMHPRYSRLLLAAQEYGCVYQAALVAALTQGRDLLLRNQGRAVDEFRESRFGNPGSSDFWLLMRAWVYAAKHSFRLEACREAGIHSVTARQVGPLLEHFLQIAKREGLDIETKDVPDECLQRSILTAFSDRVARRVDSGTLRCELVHNRRGTLARESVVQNAPLFVTAEIREIESSDKNLNTLLSLATAIEPSWLEELFPEDVQVRVHSWYDTSSKRVLAEEQRLFRDLVLTGKRLEPAPLADAARLLANEIIHGRMQLESWDHAVEQWIVRLNQLSQWCPELSLPPITDADRHHLIEEACSGAFSFKDLKSRDVQSVVRSWLSASQKEMLDKHAPERLSLPNGRKPKVTYNPEGNPFIALRIQELYEVASTPKIAMGRVPVLVHILAPSMRPVQITQDLGRFWQEHYPKVKQELQRKYPKHEWR